MTIAKLTHCPACNADLDKARSDKDGRKRSYLTRLRLYDNLAPSPDDPIADSAEGYAADHPGIDVVVGARTALTEAAALAHDYHGCGLTGMGGDVLDMKDRNIRTDMTRNGGWAVVRIPYDTMDSHTDGRQPARYLLRMDIRREGSESGNDGDSSDSKNQE